MKKYIIESIKILKTNLIFILILATAGIQIHYESKIVLLTIISVFLGLFLFPAIYGRFAEIVKGKMHHSLSQLFEKHCLDFYIVSIIVALPVFIFAFIFKGLLGWKALILVKSAISAVINVLTIYVFPVVFLRKENLSAIPSGIKYLLNNFKYNLPLVLLTILIFVVGPLGKILAVSFLSNNLFVYITVGLITNFLSLLIGFTVFITASMILIKTPAPK